MTELLTPDRVRIPLEAQSKDALLRELVGLAIEDRPASDLDEVLRAVYERESVLSTGIGHGVAIPHGKSPVVEHLVLAAGRTSAPIDFDALDGEPVLLFFLLVGPESAAGPHIRALSRISRLVRNDETRARLIAAPDAAEFLATMRDVETNLV